MVEPGTLPHDLPSASCSLSSTAVSSASFQLKYRYFIASRKKCYSSIVSAGGDVQPIRALEVDVLIFVVDIKHIHGTQNTPYHRQPRQPLLATSKRIAYVFLQITRTLHVQVITLLLMYTLLPVRPVCSFLKRSASCTSTKR